MHENSQNRLEVNVLSPDLNLHGWQHPADKAGCGLCHGWLQGKVIPTTLFCTVGLSWLLSSLRVGRQLLSPCVVMQCMDFQQQ